MAVYVLIKYDSELPAGFDAQDFCDFVVSESAGSIGGFHPKDPAFSLKRKAFSGEVFNKDDRKEVKKDDLQNLIEDILCSRYGLIPTGSVRNTGGSKNDNSSEPESGQTKPEYGSGVGIGSVFEKDLSDGD